MVKPRIIIASYSRFASALINSDESGLDARDKKNLAKFLKHTRGYNIVSTLGDPYFGHPEEGGLPGEIIDYIGVPR